MSNVSICVLVVLSTVIFAFLIVIAITIISIINSNRITNLDNDLRESANYIKATKKCNGWFSMSVLWTVVEYLSVILPFELSAFVLYLENNNEDKAQVAITVFSILSMALIIFAYAIRPHAHVKGYRRAYKYLDNAINRYLYPKRRNEITLVNAMKVGELRIDLSFDIENENCENRSYCIKTKGKMISKVKVKKIKEKDENEGDNGK